MLRRTILLYISISVQHCIVVNQNDNVILNVQTLFQRQDSNVNPVSF